METSLHSFLVAQYTQERIAEATGARQRRDAKAAQVTRSRRWFGLSSRPTFAHGRPSTSTTSAVKSLAPRINDEPTP